ncbi:hypothetical protein [Nonomuraea sp. NPDC050643]|uniref:hypothetical protein n=1 Tax=Nonomuraea sp. NPDC050643 TaxID=3155660 RepID=UPI003403876A
MAVLHPRRVAWEGARTFVFASTTNAYWWLGDTVGHSLGPAYRLHLRETRLRLQADADALYGEAGAWRARLDELIDTHPGIASTLTRLISETAARMP